jgi:hypothetical protein
MPVVVDDVSASHVVMSRMMTWVMNSTVWARGAWRKKPFSPKTFSEELLAAYSHRHPDKPVTMGVRCAWCSAILGVPIGYADAHDDSAWSDGICADCPRDFKLKPRGPDVRSSRSSLLARTGRRIPF